MTIVERPIRDAKALSLMLACYIAFREGTEEEEKVRRIENFQNLQRDRAANDNYSPEKREYLEKVEKDRTREEQSKVAQTFMIVDIGPMWIQGYGVVPINPAYIFTASTRSFGVPTNANVIGIPGAAALGYAIPYKTDEFDKAA
jgi:hypothetical protein